MLLRLLLSLSLGLLFVMLFGLILDLLGLGLLFFLCLDLFLNWWLLLLLNDLWI